MVSGRLTASKGNAIFGSRHATRKTKKYANTFNYIIKILSGI
jgi:hypothetical protein